MGNYTAAYGLYNDLFGEETTTFSNQLKTDNSEFGEYSAQYFINEGSNVRIMY
jgi:hypothetical protein